MRWYTITKVIKGQRYLYRQRSWREQGKVRTESIYIGPYDGSWQQAKDQARDERREAEPATVITTRLDRGRIQRDREIRRGKILAPIVRFRLLLKARREFNTSWQMIRLFQTLRKAESVDQQEQHAQWLLTDANKRMKSFKKGGAAYKRAQAQRKWALARRSQIRALRPFLETNANR